MNSMITLKPMKEMRQGGFSDLCLLTLNFVLGIGAYLSIRITPSYFEFKVISTALEQFARTENIHCYPRREVVNELIKTVQRNVGWGSSGLEVDKIAYLVKRDKAKVLGVNYEVVGSLISNASMLMKYQHEATLNKVEV